MTRTPVLLVTQGDPLGIGPEVIVKSLQSGILRRKACWVVIGSRNVFACEPGFAAWERSRDAVFVDVGSSGKSARDRGASAVRCLEVAVQILRSRAAHGIVTGPLCKKNACATGFAFPGHTEYLAHALRARSHAMLLFSAKLRVLPVTVHVPLRNVARILRSQTITRAILLLATSLRQDFSVRKPRLAVCGLNPHAGEDGLMGDEETRIIAPAMRRAARQLGRLASLTGPLPADTLFYRALRGEYDAVVCMYHDQALIPLKTTGFEHGVNMTLGLPVVRTSPDHGTAFDIAGRGLANPSSMQAAMRAAADIAARRMR